MLKSTLTSKLKGELELVGDTIVWTYNINTDPESYGCHTNPESYDEDNCNNFESTSNIEQLENTVDSDSEKIETYLGEIDESDNWELSDSSFNDCSITFNIH
jgi:hypothetical protein